MATRIQGAGDDASELLDVSAMTLARWIRARRVSALEVVDAHIARVEAVNHHLNAVVGRRFEAARDEARRADARVRQARDPEGLPPLLGVPCTIKEFIAVSGMPQTGGIVHRQHRTASRDATLVRRLRAAGAVILGVTNAPEGGMSAETDNRVYGRTANPWDLRCTSGGSSGGEGAIIAAGGSPLGIGSDVGGSIRIPAAFCGIVGHKPTGRMVPNTGHWPPGEGPRDAYLTCGPMARRVEDLMPVLQVISGPDPDAPLTRPWRLSSPGEVDLRGVTVYPVEGNGLIWVRGAMRRTVRRAAQTLVDAGARLGELDARKLRRGFEIWAAMMAEAPGESYAKILGGAAPISVLRELTRLPLGRSKHTLYGVLVAGAEKLAAYLPGQLSRAISLGHALRDELEAILGPRGVLLHPPYSRPAPRHNMTTLTPLDFICTGLFNVLEFPVTQVPMGFDARGLPLGVQVVGGRGQDHLTIAAAAALEAESGGWRRVDPGL